MKKTKLQTVLCCILAVGILLSMTACKKKPDPAEPSEDPKNTTQSQLQAPPDSNEDKTPQNTADEENTTAENTTGEETTGEQTTENDCVHITRSWTVEKTSTCTTEGFRYKECILCREQVETEVIPKTDHTPGRWVPVAASSCSKEGKQQQKCNQCDEVLLIISMEKTPHNTYTIPGHEATATTTGLTDGKKCRTCNATVVEQQIIPVLGSTGYWYTVNSDEKSCTITGRGNSTDKLVNIPGAMSSYKVTGIGKEAFQNQGDITELYLPSSVAHIGEYAFYGCSRLTQISFQGTVAQWKAVVKDTAWDMNTGNYTVRCSDGTVTK